MGNSENCCATAQRLSTSVRLFFSFGSTSALVDPVEKYAPRKNGSSNTRVTQLTVCASEVGQRFRSKLVHTTGASWEFKNVETIVTAVRNDGRIHPPILESQEPILRGFLYRRPR